jgi:hypothetical protein
MILTRSKPQYIEHHLSAIGGMQSRAKVPTSLSEYWADIHQRNSKDPLSSVTTSALESTYSDVNQSISPSRCKHNSRNTARLFLLINERLVSSVQTLHTFSAINGSVRTPGGRLPILPSLLDPELEYMHRIMGRTYSQQSRHQVEIDAIYSCFSRPSSELIQLLRCRYGPYTDNCALF